MYISHVTIFCFCALSSCSVILASEDLYSMLGVPRSASTKEIKRAFRKKAQMYHPDKNKTKEAEAMYLKINRAHDILTDKEKRAQYDKYGEAAFQNGDSGEGPGHDPFDFFSGFSFNRGGDGDDNKHFFEGGSFFNSFDDFFSDDSSFGDGMFGDMFTDGGDSFFSSSSTSSRKSQNCRTVTQRVGNTIMTTTECS